MHKQESQVRFDWRIPLRTGLLGGVIAVFICLVGVVEASSVRPIIYPVLNMGQTLVILTYVMVSFMAVRRARASQEGSRLPAAVLVGSGAVAGLITSVFLAALVFIGRSINLRNVFIRASPGLFDLLTFKLDTGPGAVALLVAGLVVGALVAGIFVLPERLRKALTLGLGLIPVLAVLANALFARRGLSSLEALIVFAVATGGSYLWSTYQDRIKQRVESLPPKRQRALQTSRWVLFGLAIVLVPLLGTFPSEVMNNVALYVLMGLGLNIVVGFAGLLDLGYVAFYALGAYTMGILTSPEIGWLGFNLTFWQALPFAVLVATLAGVILGIPVLGMRGDYLAIVTLGFGEIIFRVFLSDWLKPLIGGSNGITLIPKPEVAGIRFDTPQTLYYIFLAGCVLAAFISIRLKNSRLGRAWMAMREDEDVAQAMGIDLVKTKLLAFATGAALSGLSGAIFASKLESIYPHSFQLLVSINALGVIIVGGMGSIPGVIVGSLALVGLPELLREFAEYRLLVYGAALVFMMLTLPEGLLPEARRKLELHEETIGVGD